MDEVRRHLCQWNSNLTLWSKELMDKTRGENGGGQPHEGGHALWISRKEDLICSHNDLESQHAYRRQSMAACVYNSSMGQWRQVDPWSSLASKAWLTLCFCFHEKLAQDRKTGVACSGLDMPQGHMSLYTLVCAPQMHTHTHTQLPTPFPRHTHILIFVKAINKQCIDTEVIEKQENKRSWEWLPLDVCHDNHWFTIDLWKDLTY